MSFFQQLAALELVGDIKLTIKTLPDKMIVSVLVDNEKCGDNARKAIPPLVLSGTAAELDEGFFATVGQPLQITSGLQVDMEAHLKAVEAAKKQSAMAKSTTPVTPAKPAIDPKKVAYDNAMKAVQGLVNAKKYKDAIGKLPDAKEHPAKKSVIDARKSWLMQMALDGGGMFPQPYPSDVEDAPVTTPVAEAVAPTPDKEEDADQETEEEETADSDQD